MTLCFWLGYQRPILWVDAISVVDLVAIVRHDRCSRRLLE